MKQRKTTKTFLILDCDSHPIARGFLLNGEDESDWHVQVLGDMAQEAAKFRELQLVGLSDYQDSFLVRVTALHEDQLDVEPLRPLAEAVRENLRIPVSFSSLIYPISGAWKGRRRIQSVNLSCGGISFYCEEPLADGETLEVVIPITRQPLVLTGKVLRQFLSQGNTIYAVSFTELCDEADKLIREAVFSEQIRSHVKSNRYQNQGKVR